MGAPIRSSTEITVILNKAQHALADLGAAVINDLKRGIDNTESDHRDKEYQLLLTRIYLQTLLTPDGNLKNYYTASANQVKLNKMLDGLVSLTGIFGGPAIPMLGRRNLPLYFFPNGTSSGGGSGGPALPGGTVIQGTANSPVTTMDIFNASLSNFAFYIINVQGQNPSEGSRTDTITVTFRGSNDPVFNITSTQDEGGTTAPIVLSVVLSGGNIELLATTSTDGWIITGLRILFQNISFVNPIGPMPPGGTTHQLLRKASNTDYNTEWFTLTVAALTDLVASVTELNYSQGVTSAIQTQINALSTALGNYLLLIGGTMSGPIAMGNHKITGLTDGSSAQDAASKNQMDIAVAAKVSKTGDSMAGDLAFFGNKVTTIGAATAPGDAVNKSQMDTAIATAAALKVSKSGDSMSGALAMGANKITGLAAATANGDAVRFEQVPIFTKFSGNWAVTNPNNTIAISTGIPATSITGITVCLRDQATGTIYTLPNYSGDGTNATYTEAWIYYQVIPSGGNAVVQINARTSGALIGKTVTYTLNVFL